MAELNQYDHRCSAIQIRKFGLILIILTQFSTPEGALFNIGGIFANVSNEELFRNAIDAANMAPEAYGLGAVRLNYSTSFLHKDPIETMKNICSKLVNNSVYLVITDRLMNNTRPPYIVSYACAFYNIPVIGVASRESQFSDKSLHSFFLRTVPSYADEVRPLVEIVKNFKWTKVILISSNEEDYRKFFIQFTSLAYDNSITIEHPIIFASGTKNLTMHLKNVATKQSKVIVFGGRGQDAVNLYTNAKKFGLAAAGYIWLVSSEAAQGIALKNAPHGALTVRPKGEGNIKPPIQDAIKITAAALGRLNKDGTSLTSPPSSCSEPPGVWESGKAIYRALVNRTYTKNMTEPVKLDVAGNKVNSAYEIFNLRASGEGNNFLYKIGNFDRDGNISIAKSSILWPGNQTVEPKGVFISSHLKIVTAESRPFVITYQIPKGGNCSDLNIVERGLKRQFVKCVGPSTHLPGNEHCCTGFCMDLLVKLAGNLNFTYDLHLSGDLKFGALVEVNGSNIKRWDGAVGEVISGKADLIVASLTVTNERAQYIEFSKPYKYQGITILVKKNLSTSTLVSFLRPFKTELWLLVLLSVHVVGVILYVLDRLSPFGRFKQAKTNNDEQVLDLPSAMWFSWGVLLNSGIGEVTPRSFSARVLGMVWAAFSMIIVASYTANLAAFLVLDRPQPVVSGIDDPNLRNPSDSFPFATGSGSSTEAYFKRQVELSNMYTFMEKYNVKTGLEGIQKVKSGELKAFIWDSPVLLYETSSNCDLTTAGEIFGRSGYAIGMPKGSPWSDSISVAILHFHESGIIERLESAWIEFGNCPQQSSSPTTLGLSHMLGVFIMVAIGVGAGIIIVLVEVVYYRRKGMRREQMSLAAKCAEQWKATTVEARNMKAKKHSVMFPGVNGIEMNGNHNHNVGYEAENDTTSR